MTRFTKISTTSMALAAMSTPAFAHIGDHSATPADHFLVDHGLALGSIALIIAIGTIAYILKTKA